MARGTKLEGEGLVGRAVDEGWTGVVAKGACVLGLVDWEVTIYDCRLREEEEGGIQVRKGGLYIPSRVEECAARVRGG